LITNKSTADSINEVADKQWT